MKKLSALLCLSAVMAGCGGGGGGSDGAVTATPTAKVSFGITDAPVDDAAAVVITIDKIILRRDGAADVVVDTFTIAAQGGFSGVTNADTFQIDLLDFRNGNRLPIVQNLDVPAGTYSQLILQVIDGDVNTSYVEEISPTRYVPIKQPSGDLKLGGFTASAGGVYVYTLDFDLRKAMTYNPGNNGNGQDRYILKPRGVRLIDQALAASLSGTVDTALFNPATIPACANKVNSGGVIDPYVGNVVYLYPGNNLAPSSLVDIYDPEVAQTLPLPIGAVNPYAAAEVFYLSSDAKWHYNFGYLPAGSYTLAFSCNAVGDYAETYDGISIPLPTDQRIDVTLSSGQSRTCNLPVSGGTCAP